MGQKVLGNCEEGLLFIVSAPAGTGKTTLVRMLTQEFSCVVESISYTTRPKREGEQSGKDYFFVTQKDFEDKKKRGAFLESAEVFGHMYGTSKEFIETKQKEGKHVVLVIDTQGALSLQSMGIKASFIFIAPPSFEVLEHRLVQRNTEDMLECQKRLSWAHKEMDLSLSYDYFIVNSELEVAYEVLKSILIAQEHRTGQ